MCVPGMKKSPGLKVLTVETEPELSVAIGSTQFTVDPVGAVSVMSAGHGTVMTGAMKSMSEGADELEKIFFVSTSPLSLQKAHIRDRDPFSDHLQCLHGVVYKHTTQCPSNIMFSWLLMFLYLEFHQHENLYIYFLLDCLNDLDIIEKTNSDITALHCIRHMRSQIITNFEGKNNSYLSHAMRM